MTQPLPNRNFRWQYLWRIMGRIGEDAPIELYRSNDVFWTSQWDFQVRDLGPEWTVWREQRTPEKSLISQRMIP